MTEEPSIKEALNRIQDQIADLQGEHEVMAGPFDTSKWKIEVSVADLQALVSTLQPSGERREAIARIIAPDTFAKFDAELAKGRRAENGRCWAELCYSEVLNAAREKADLILASGFVQDEAGIRADEREKIAKEADKKAAVLLDAAERLSVYMGATKLAYTEADLHEQAGTVIGALADSIRSARDGGAET